LFLLLWCQFLFLASLAAEPDAFPVLYLATELGAPNLLLPPPPFLLPLLPPLLTLLVPMLPMAVAIRHK
jgi:hypothetical protein